jgi:hypothetical protein
MRGMTLSVAGQGIAINVPRGASFARATERRGGVDPETVTRGRKRQTVEDLKNGPNEPRSTFQTRTEEAITVAFRRRTLAPPDERLDSLQPTIPRLTGSELDRCLQRHGIPRLPDVEDPSHTHKHVLPGDRQAEATDVQAAR